MKVEYKLSNREIKKVNKKCYLGVGIDDTLKFCIQYRGLKDWLTGWLKISREAIVLKFYKTLKRPHLEYSTQVWAPLSTHGNWNVILKLEDIQRRVTKIIKRVKDYINRERSENLELTTFLEKRIRDHLIETFKIINGISNHSWHFFLYLSRNGNLLSR